MNCNEISTLLDDGDIARLDSPLQRKIAAHLAACADCAMDWEIQERLRQLSDLPMPAAFAGACRAAVAGSAQPVPVRRVANGYVLGAAVLAVAAAAAMLAVRGDRSAPMQPSAAAAHTPLVRDVGAVMDTSMTPPIARTVDGQRLAPASSPSFSIGVLPLGNHGNDAAGQAAIDGFHAAILDGLRRDADIRLRLVDSREAAEGEVDFLLDVSGYTTEKGLRGMLRATRLGANPLTLPIAGEFGAGCVRAGASQSQRCLDGAGLADSMLRTLRNVLLPFGPGQRQELVARVRNSAVAPERRLAALQDLVSLRASVPAAPTQRLEPAAALADPALLRGAIDLAAVAAPAQRAEVWRILRGVRQPELIDPLIQSARLDVDATVRVEAVSTLGAGFADDPRVRTELDLVARQDPRPLVRALAQRALTGEEAWRGYVVAALKDGDLPAAERLEPLFHHLNGGSGGLAEVFDEATIRGFAAALAQARDTPLARRTGTLVFSRAADVESAAMTDLLLAAFRENAGLNRMTLLNQLVRRRGDARVEALLQQVSTSDPDLQLRQIAARALAEDSAAPPARK